MIRRILKENVSEIVMNASIKRERLKPSSSISIRNNHNNNFTKRLKNRICSNSCLKIIYLSCATLISASFIIECILLHLIIIPYLSESIFEEDYSTVTSDATIISTDTSNYTIFYDFESSESRIVYLYDYFSTFTAYKTSRCATSPCHRREEDNKLAVEEFKRDLSRRNIFRCYATPTPSHTTLTTAEIQIDLWNVLYE
ncbi:hypothetical protein Smp_146260 [Schistosoma mansoni]|uniref:hypothetical protein n=1 Tax=Schistosoma mansoni TaxID=6183 RepID=UPI0001A631D8|nr:hypothetical protein Smp_146260 [Schistosoma mansoni]|eukprot:XP_018646188.1 hypothetical protein Smp_146260 [Schistosoma mansoni]